MKDHHRMRAWCHHPDDREGHYLFQHEYAGYWYREDDVNKSDPVDLRDYFNWDEAPNPIMEQCTGLRDKNGVMIYEGDTYISILGRKEIVDRISVSRWLIDEYDMNNPMSRVKIIGNIRQNPELLS